MQARVPRTRRAGRGAGARGSSSRDHGPVSPVDKETAMKARAVLTQPFSSSRRSRVYSSMTLFYIPEVDWKPFLRRSAGLGSLDLLHGAQPGPRFVKAARSRRLTFSPSTKAWI